MTHRYYHVSDTYSSLLLRVTHLIAHWLYIVTNDKTICQKGTAQEEESQDGDFLSKLPPLVSSKLKSDLLHALPEAVFVFITFDRVWVHDAATSEMHRLGASGRFVWRLECRVDGTRGKGTV